MRSLRLVNIAALLLASAVFCYGQHGRSGSSMGGSHMGGGSSGASNGAGNSADHGSQAGSTQSQKPSPEQLLNQNTKLTSNLQKLLPEGTTPQQACSGFTNLGRCVAAIHVANNLGIPFADLKAKVTGSGSESLGKAIQDLKPEANAGTEQKKAQAQSKADMAGSSN
jgi:hypothetical protein